MNLLEELKDVVEVKVTVDEKKLSDKLFDKAVMPLLKKVTKDIIPTEIDDAYLAANVDKIKAAFQALMEKAGDAVEDKIEEALGKDEK